MIKLLYNPPTPFHLLPRCEAIRETVYANDTPDTNKQCERKAIVEIDNKKLCMQHAGPIAVRKLIKIEERFL